MPLWRQRYWGKSRLSLNAAAPQLSQAKLAFCRRLRFGRRCRTKCRRIKGTEFMFDTATARRMMVDCQVRTADVTDLELIAAMAALPRERFVPAALAEQAYRDGDIAIGDGRVLLKPMVLAKLIQAARVRGSNSVLDVGCGTGYSSAVLARLAGSVVALEEDAGLAQQAKVTLAATDGSHVTVATAPLTAGWPEAAPYDVILLNGATEIVPETLGRQLKPDGRLACILGRGPNGKAMIYRQIEGQLLGRPVFDAAAPVLPALSRRWHSFFSDLPFLATCAQNAAAASLDFGCSGWSKAGAGHHLWRLCANSQNSVSCPPGRGFTLQSARLVFRVRLCLPCWRRRCRPLSRRRICRAEPTGWDGERCAGHKWQRTAGAFFSPPSLPRSGRRGARLRWRVRRHARMGLGAGVPEQSIAQRAARVVARHRRERSASAVRLSPKTLRDRQRRLQLFEHAGAHGRSVGISEHRQLHQFRRTLSAARRCRDRVADAVQRQSDRQQSPPRPRARSWARARPCASPSSRCCSTPRPRI